MNGYEYRTVFRHYDGTIVELTAGVTEDWARHEAARVAETGRESWIERRQIPAWERVQ